MFGERDQLGRCCLHLKGYFENILEVNIILYKFDKINLFLFLVIYDLI